MTTLTKPVTLNPGHSQQVSFQVVPTEAGPYQVSVNGLTGGFTAIPPTEARVASVIWTYFSGCEKWGMVALEYWFNLPAVRLILPTPDEAVSVISNPNFEIIELVAHGPPPALRRLVMDAMAQRPNPYRFAIAFMCEGQTPEGGVATALLKDIKSGNVGLGMRGMGTYLVGPALVGMPFKAFLRYFCSDGTHPPNIRAGLKAGDAWEAALAEEMEDVGGWTQEREDWARWHYVFWGDPEVRAVDML